MDTDLDITIILPAYNEVKRISQTISEIQNYLRQNQLSYEIIVAADGDDGTRELVVILAEADPGIKVIGNEERRGKGYGIRQAVKLSRGKIVGYVDADNKTPIQELDKIRPRFKEGYHVVFGSRGLPESHIFRAQPFIRRVGSKGFRYFMQIVVGLPDIVDTQCGFKFFVRNVALDLFNRQKIDGYMFDVEILYLARKAGYRCKEVPINWRDDADTRLNLITGNIRNAVDIFRIKFYGGYHTNIVTVKTGISNE